MQKAKNLKLAITAGIGSDHVDLNAAAEHGLTVAEATGTSSSHGAQMLSDYMSLMQRFLACALYGDVLVLQGSLSILKLQAATTSAQQSRRSSVFSGKPHRGRLLLAPL